MKCEGCGVESPLESLFVRGRKFVGRGHFNLCPVCITRQRTLELRTVFALFLIVIAFDLVVARRDGGAFPINLILLVAFEYLSIIPHELAHAAASWLMRMEVFQITFGIGRRWAHAIVDGTLIEARMIPICGAVSSSSLDPRLWRLRRLVIVAAGPIANLVICLGAVWMAGGWPRIAQLRWIDHLAPWLMLAITNAILVLANLLRWGTGIQGIYSDGVQLFNLLFRPLPSIGQRRVTYIRARAAALSAARSYQQLDSLVSRFGSELPRSELAHWRSIVDLEGGNFHAAKTHAVQALDQYLSPSFHRAIGLNTIAWTDLLTGQSELVPEAERFSAEAYALLPWVAGVQSTRGWALVESGDVDAGMSLLLQSLRGVAYNHDRASVLCTLAIAEARRGRPNRASQLCRKARRLDQNCTLLDRAEGELKQISALPG